MPSPDPAIGQAALENAQLGRDWLAFSRDQFAIGNERQEDTDALTRRVIEQQLATQDKNNANADAQYQFYKDTFQPVERQMVDEAVNYDSAERKDAMAGQAAMEVGKQFAASRDANARAMARMGVNPNSGKFQVSANATAVQEALGKAAASTKARTDAENMGMMLRKDAAAFGRNMTGTAAQQYGLGLNAGNSALSGNAGANQQWANNNAIMNQGFQGAMSGNSSSASILNQQYQNQLAGWQAEQQSSSGLFGGIGSLVGTLGGSAISKGGWAGLFSMSSKDVKENKRPIREEDALEAVRKTPVESWKYKEGAGDGGTHVGPYAQDVQQNMGEQAAPQGRMVDLVSLNGISMAAIQALDKKVQKLEKQSGKGK